MAASADIGQELRAWRTRRRLSQLDLALDAGISTRHLSFIETGRSQPRREMLLRILRQLDVPFREQNALLLAAGFAPAFPERPLDDPELAPVRAALDLILRGHDPHPAVVVDRHWNLVAANATLMAMVALADVDPALLEPPVNVLRAGLHPRGLAPLLVNLDDWLGHFRARLSSQVAASGDEFLADLLEEISSYPGGGSEARATSEVLGPLKARAPDGRELSFLGLFATFDTPFEVTASELAIELLYPTDEATRAALADFARERGEAGG